MEPDGWRPATQDTTPPLPKTWEHFQMRASAPGGEVITLVFMNAYFVDIVVTSERSWKLVIGNNDSTGPFFNGKLCTGILTR